MGLRSKLELLQARTGFFPTHIPARPIFSHRGHGKLKEKPPPSQVNLTESRENGRNSDFKKSKLSLEGGGQGRTSPGLKLSFPAPFLRACSHPWTTSTHPARKVAWMCSPRECRNGDQRGFPRSSPSSGGFRSHPRPTTGRDLPRGIRGSSPPLLILAGGSTWSSALCSPKSQSFPGITGWFGLERA